MRTIDGVTYPNENRDILQLVVKYGKMGVKQECCAQFRNGALETKGIYVDYVAGMVEFPDSVKSMEDVVDFIYNYSYSPKIFVEVDSVKFPRYLSPCTTHLIQDDDLTDKMKQYLVTLKNN